MQRAEVSEASPSRLVALLCLVIMPGGDYSVLGWLVSRPTDASAWGAEISYHTAISNPVLMYANVGIRYFLVKSDVLHDFRAAGPPVDGAKGDARPVWTGACLPACVCACVRACVLSMVMRHVCVYLEPDYYSEAAKLCRSGGETFLASVWAKNSFHRGSRVIWGGSLYNEPYIFVLSRF